MRSQNFLDVFLILGRGGLFLTKVSMREGYTLSPLSRITVILNCIENKLWVIDLLRK